MPEETLSSAEAAGRSVCGAGRGGEERAIPSSAGVPGPVPLPGPGRTVPGGQELRAAPPPAARLEPPRCHWLRKGEIETTVNF